MRSPGKLRMLTRRHMHCCILAKRTRACGLLLRASRRCQQPFNFVNLHPIPPKPSAAVPNAMSCCRNVTSNRCKAQLAEKQCWLSMPVPSRTFVSLECLNRQGRVCDRSRSTPVTSMPWWQRFH